MPTIGIRDLKNRASEIVRKVREEQIPYIITLRGKPSAMIIPLEENEVEDYIIAHHPYFVMLRDKSRKEIYEGDSESED
ncbi:MAG: type II toxin-antitoxin system Phd/YefM family antitoxin [Thermoleophilia bacterium]